MNINLTLIGQSIAFIFFVWFCLKFIWPPITNALEERRKKIADGLADAEAGHQKLEQAEIRFTEIVDEGKQEAASIISLAQKRGDEIIDESKQSAKEEGNRILEATKSDIEQEKEQARKELRQQVATLVIAGAEQILMKEIDQKAHNELLEKISSDL